MKLQPLRCLCEVVDNGLSVTRAAEKLHTSPSGISKHLKLLEDEVGLPLLERKRTRIVGVSAAGLAALPVIRRILKDIDRVRRIADETTGRWRGQLTIASTHNHSRYALIPVIRQFVKRYPGVELQLRHGTPSEIGRLVTSGEVDIGIGTAPAGADAALLKIPCYQLRHCVVVPRGHALLRAERITLEDVARYPLIVNYPESRVGRLVEEAFSSRGIEFAVAIRAMDSSVIKKYIEEGLGIAVLPEFTIDRREDAGLRAIPADHLFKPSTTCVIIAREQNLPEFGADFVRMVSGLKRGGRVS